MTAKARVARRPIVFASLWLLLIAISVHDGYLLWANRLDIEHLERNPQGRLLLHLGGGDVWLFLAAKLFGTTIAATALIVLYRIWPRAGWAACITISLLQLCLLFYLYMT